MALVEERGFERGMTELADIRENRDSDREANVFFWRRIIAFIFRSSFVWSVCLKKQAYGRLAYNVKFSYQQCYQQQKLYMYSRRKMKKFSLDQ